MKLNKTLMIAALIAGSVFAADYAVRAQDSTNTPPAARPPAGPGARGGRMNFDNIATQLALTDDQKTKAKPIFEDMQKQMADLRTDTTMSPADRRAKYQEIREGTTTKLKDILTPEQFAKWQKMGAPRRPAGAGVPPPAGGATPPAGGTQPQK
jgi:Spy/CpxP family protein refolding chaperone